MTLPIARICRDPRTVEKRLARAERRTDLLEDLVVATRRDSATLVRELATANAELAAMQRLMPNPLLVVDGAGAIVHVNPATTELLGRAETDLLGARAALVWPGYQATGDARREVDWSHADGSPIPVLVSVAHASTLGGERVVCTALDLRERQRIEIARRHAQKLESLGQLSAGIAHEINTPMQYIGDNLHVLERAVGAMRAVLDRMTDVCAAARTGDVPRALLDAVEATIADTRWRDHSDRQPRAIAGARDGVRRVSEIVGAMKRFAHPGNDRAPVDVDAALATALVVVRPEIKHVATVLTELGGVPRVPGCAADLNQVFLNLLVNAAHAIEDAAGSGEPGTITVRTRACPAAGTVEIAIADTGGGIPEAIRDRVYDPFFTTKAPGRGTGQGLALAHAIVVERHGGTLHFESAPTGTTFFVTLPIDKEIRP